MELVMVIIIGKEDLQLPDFPFDLIEYGKMHAKIIAIEELEHPQSYHVTRSIYHDVDKHTFDKSQIINLIERAL